MSGWDVHAIRYAERNARRRGDSFIFDENHDAPHPMDYYLWVLRRDGRTILVDTGYDVTEAAARSRPILSDPRDAIRPLGLTAEDIDEIIITHLHYDHAGGMKLFPNARLYMQAAEMAYATGPCMCQDALRAPFTGDHICEAVQRLFSGRVIFFDGDGAIADGVTVHRVGGHSRGLQCVRVRTEAGWLVLASDAAHYYENFIARKPFPIVVDMEDMLNGFDLIQSLASRPGLVVPGHDPEVRRRFPAGSTPESWRLDRGPLAGF